MSVGDHVLVDTSALYSLHCDSDAFYHSAWAVYRWLTERGDSLWVTSYTLVETVALVHRRLGFGRVLELEEWREGRIRVLWVDDRAHAETWRLYVSQQGQGMNFVDCSVAIAARKMGATIFTFDSDFANQGLPVVVPP